MYVEEVVYKSSRLKILLDNKKLISVAYDELVKQRDALEGYIKKNKFFESSLKPVDVDKKAPPIVRLLAEGGKIAGVGPMAAVAGTIAELVCRKLMKKGAQMAIVENGGDIFAVTNIPITVGLFVGKNELSGRIAFKLDGQNTPIAICSSSSFMGHSLSFGKCDLATVFSKKGNVADAAATALGNKVKTKKDVKNALKWVIWMKDVDGALIIKEDNVGAIGNIPPMVGCEDKNIKEKVTMDDIYKAK